MKSTSSHVPSPQYTHTHAHTHAHRLSPTTACSCLTGTPCQQASSEIPLDSAHAGIKRAQVRCRPCTMHAPCDRHAQTHLYRNTHTYIHTHTHTVTHTKVYSEMLIRYIDDPHGCAHVWAQQARRHCFPCTSTKTRPRQTGGFALQCSHTHTHTRL